MWRGDYILYYVSLHTPVRITACSKPDPTSSHLDLRKRPKNAHEIDYPGLRSRAEITRASASRFHDGGDAEATDPLGMKEQSIAAKLIRMDFRRLIRDRSHHRNILLIRNFVKIGEAGNRELTTS